MPKFRAAKCWQGFRLVAVLVAMGSASESFALESKPASVRRLDEVVHLAYFPALAELLGVTRSVRYDMPPEMTAPMEFSASGRGTAFSVGGPLASTVLRAPALSFNRNPWYAQSVCSVSVSGIASGNTTKWYVGYSQGGTYYNGVYYSNLDGQTSANFSTWNFVDGDFFAMTVHEYTGSTYVQNGGGIVYITSNPNGPGGSC